MLVARAATITVRALLSFCEFQRWNPRTVILRDTLSLTKDQRMEYHEENNTRGGGDRVERGSAGVCVWSAKPLGSAREGSEKSERGGEDRVQVVPRGFAFGAQVTRQGEEMTRKKRERSR